MTDHVVNLAATLPRGYSVNSLDRFLAEEIWDLDRDEHEVPPRVAIVILDLKETKKSQKRDERAVVLEVAAVELLTGKTELRAARDILRDRAAARLGSFLLPHDLAGLLRRAFADLPRDASEVDEDEENEREGMTPADEVRRHLERIHGATDARSMTDMEAYARHSSDHEPGVLPDGLVHDPDDHFWTRADIEAHEAAGEDAAADAEPTLFDGADADALYEGSAQTAQDSPFARGGLILSPLSHEDGTD